MPAAPAHPQMFKDSYAPVQVSLGYQPNPFTGGKLVELPAYDVLISASIEFSSATGWIGHLVLFDPDQKFFKNALIPGLGARFVLRFYWDNNPNLGFAAPTFRGNVSRMVPDFEYGATKVTIDLQSDQVSSASLNKNLPPRTFKPNMLASEIAAQIAASAWPGTNTVIEPSTVPIPHGFNLGEQSHWQFIQQTLLPLARNDRGDGFTAWLDPQDETFHFHSGKWQTFKKKLHKYVYARDVAGEVISFAPEDNSMFAAIAGASDATYASVDSKGGKLVEQKATGARGVKEPGKDQQWETSGNHPTTYKGEDVVPVMASSSSGAPQPTQAYVPLVARTPEEAGSRAVSAYSTAKNQQFKATLEVKGTHDIRVTDPVQVDYYVSETPDPHYLSGLYDVFSVRHTLDSGGWKTSFTVLRQAYASAPGGNTQDVKGKKVDVPKSDFL